MVIHLNVGRIGEIYNAGEVYEFYYDKTIEAVWELNTYTITYDLKGGNLPSGKTNPTSYNVTTAEITLNDPVRRGYDFVGWTGSNLTTAQTKVKIPKGSTGNKSYTANWTPKVYTITLDNQSATTAGSTAVYQKYNTGIYKESGCTTQMTTSANPITVPQKAYKVTYTYNEATGGNSTANATATYTFGGYYTSTNGGGTAVIDKSGYLDYNMLNTQFASDVTLYAKWTSASVTLPTPTRTGYTFGGWYKESSLTNKAGDGGASYTPTEEITLYAKWTPNVYTITLNNQSATSAGTTVLYEKYGVGFYTDSACTNEFKKYTSGTGSTITKPTKTEYEFMGYYTSTNGGGTVVIDKSGYLDNQMLNTQFASDVTLYAYWDRPVYTIILDNQSATSAGTTRIYEKYTVGFYLDYSSTIEIPTTTSGIGSIINLPERDGYVFYGYYTGTNGSGTQIINRSGCMNSSIENTKFTSNTTIYAYWRNIFTITLNNQSATSAGTTKVYEKYGVGIYTDSSCTTALAGYSSGGGKKITVPTKTGYTFGGYYTSTNGNGYMRISSLGYLTTDFENTDYTYDATLYAYWIQKADGVPYTPSIKASYSTSSGSVNVPSGTWSRNNLTITITSNGFMSGNGKANIQYSYDKSNWYSYNGSFTYSTETSSKYIYARAVNSANTSIKSGIISYEIKLDKTKPKVYVDVRGHNSAISSYLLDVKQNGNTYYIHYDNNKAYDIDVYPISFSDNLSGAVWHGSYTGSLKWQEGQYLESKVYVTDASGNTSSTYTFKWYGNNKNAPDKWPY